MKLATKSVLLLVDDFGIDMEASFDSLNLEKFISATSCIASEAQPRYSEKADSGIWNGAIYMPMNA